MARPLHALAVAALILTAGLSFDARLAEAQADALADCSKGRGDIKIRACSRIINSGRLYGRRISKRNLAKAYKKRGAAYGHKSQYDRAIADFSQWIKLYPRDAQAYNNRGLAFESNGQFNNAIADYDKAIKLHPGDRMATGRLKAIADFRKAGG